MSKWSKMTHQSTKTIIDNIIKEMDAEYINNLKGPYYCNDAGDFRSMEDVSKPSYDPYLIFYWEKNTKIVYHPGSDTFKQLSFSELYDFAGNCISIPITRKDIRADIIDIIFNKRSPSVYKKEEIGSFAKFVFPLIKKAYPKNLMSNLISVQPMTGPSGGIAFYSSQYAKQSKNTV